MEILGLFDISTTWILVSALPILIYLYGKKRNRVFKDLGIPGPEPTIFLGNLPWMMKMGANYEPSEYGEVYGWFLGGMPILNIENTDMMREILIKQFAKFTDRMMFTLDDYPVTKGLFFQKGDVWRRLRRITNPTFSASKLRLMSDKMISCCDKLANNFLKAASDKSEVLIKDYMGVFTLDVIASTSFGMDTNSQDDLNNRLYTEAKKAIGEAGFANISYMLPVMFPELWSLFTKLGFSAFPKGSRRYLADVVTQMVKQRREESSKVQRVDFLQLLIDAEDNDSDGVMDKSNLENNSNKHMTTEEVIGQALIFFVAGYETTATTLHYAAYLLATNPEVQERALEEIQTVLGDKSLTYDNLKELVYMDHVIAETTRLFPAVSLIHREASETVEIQGYIIPKGMRVAMYPFRIQRNPKYFPDPNKFLPERWERKSEIDPMSNLPFGLGPRQCIGMRLAQVEMKFALATVLRKVKFLPGANTPMTLEAKDLDIRNTIVTRKELKLRVEAR